MTPDKCENDELTELRQEDSGLSDYLNEMADGGRYYMFCEENQKDMARIDARRREIAARIAELTGNPS